MATFDLNSSVNALPDTPIIPNYPEHPVVKAKILEFSMFKGFEPVDIKDQLLQYFNSSNMLVIKHTDTPQPVPIQLMTLEDLVSAISQKLKSEPQAIVGDKDINTLELITAKVNAQDEESASAMEDLQLMAYGCVIDAMASRIIKRGALYLNPFTQKPVLLLGNRGLFISDKQKIAAAEARQRKAELRSAKAAKSGQPKDDSAQRKRPSKQRPATEDQGVQSAGSLDDVSCHGGDGSSPYSSEWERASRNSLPSTPILIPTHASQNEHQSAPILQDNSTVDVNSASKEGPANAIPNLTLPAPQPLGIQLAPSPFLPLVPGSPHLQRARGLNMAASFMGPSGSTYSGPAQQSSKSARRKSGRSKKSKKSKSKRSRSRSRSRSSSSLSVKSVEIPAPRPSVDQVFLYTVSCLPS